jgi:hypothetical protein
VQTDLLLKTSNTSLFSYFVARVRIAASMFYCKTIVYCQINARIWTKHRKIGGSTFMGWVVVYVVCNCILSTISTTEMHA